MAGRLPFLPTMVLQRILAVTLLLLCTPDLRSAPIAEAHTIDGCNVVNEVEPSSREVTIAAETQTTPHATQIIVSFKNCHIPPNVDIRVAVPSSNGDGAVPSVHVEVEHTTMNGGSFQIIPHNAADDSHPQSTAAAPHIVALRHVYIIVTNVSFTNCSSHVMSVNMAQPWTVDAKRLVQNVSIVVQDTVIASKYGSIASILMERADDAVNEVMIVVRGNSTLESGNIVASVRTSSISNSTLMANSCTGPIDVRSNGSGGMAFDQVGVLSILPIPTGTGRQVILFLENVHVLATNKIDAATGPSRMSCQRLASSPTIRMIAASPSGSAATAGVVVRHRIEAKVTISGFVTFEIDVVAAEEPFQNDLDHHDLQLEASVPNSKSAVAVAGIALLAYDDETALHTTVVLLEEAHLTFSGPTRVDSPARTQRGSNTDLATKHYLHGTTAGSVSAIAVLGVAMNSFHSGSAVVGVSAAAQFIMCKRSALNISALTGNVVMLARNENGMQVAASLLGVAVLSYAAPQSSGSNTVTSLSLLESSTISVSVSTTQLSGAGPRGGDARRLSVATNGSFVASSMMGIALISFVKMPAGKNTATTSLTISQNSLLTTRISVANDIDVEVSSPSSCVATTVGGIAMQSYSLVGSTGSNKRSKSLCSCTVDSNSTLRLEAQMSHAANVSILSAINDTHVASAVFGVAMISYSSFLGCISESTTIFALDDFSHLRILLGRSGSGEAALLSSSTSSQPNPDNLLPHTVHSTFGVALNSFSTSNEDTLSRTLLTVSGTSCASIISQISGKSGIVSLLTSPTTWGKHLAATVLGFAINCGSNSLKSTEETTSSLFTIRDASRVSIVSTITARDVVSLRTSSVGGLDIAVSMLAVAMHSYSFGQRMSYNQAETSVFCNCGSNSVLLIENRSAIAIASQILRSGTVLLQTPTIGGGKMARATLGIALNSYSWCRSVSQVSKTYTSSTSLSNSSFTIRGQSNLSIASRTSDNENATITSPSVSGYLAVAVLGVALYSYPVSDAFKSTAMATSYFIIDDRSNVDVLFVNAGGGNVRITTPTQSLSLAAAVGGVALGSLSISNKGTGATVFVIKDNSTLKIALRSVSSGNQEGYVDCPSQMAILQPIASASAVFGIAINGWARYGPRSTGSTHLLVDRWCRVNIVSEILPSDAATLSLLRTHQHTHFAAALFGVAMNIRTDSSVGDASMKVDGTARVVLHAMLSHKRAVIQAESEENSATAVVGVALAAQRSATLAVLEIGDDEGAVPMIDVWAGVLDGCSMQATPASSQGTTAVVGVIAKTTFSGLSNKNVGISWCSDGKTNISGTVGGVAMDTKPSIADFTPQHTSQWNGLATTTNTTEQTSEVLAMCVAKYAIVPLSVQQTLQRMSSSLCSTSPHLEWQLWFTDVHQYPATPTKTAATQTPTPSAKHTGSVTQSLTLLQQTSSEAMPTVPATLSLSSTVSRPSSTTTILHPNDGNSPSPALKTETPPPVTQEQRSKQRSVRITTSVLLPENRDAATVVLSTAGASTAVAATLGASGGGAIVAAGSSVRMMECGLTDDDPRPASFELPIQFALGNTATRYFSGAALAHTVVQCSVFTASIVARRWTQKKRVNGATTSRKVASYLSMVFCGAHTFFTPAILGACSTVLNSGNRSNLSLAVASGSALLIVLLHGTVVLAVHQGPQHGIIAKRVSSSSANAKWKLKLRFVVVTGSRSHTETTTTTSTTTSSSSTEENERTTTTSVSDSGEEPAWLFSGSATKDLLLTLFDGCRHFEQMTHRHYTSIETTLNSVIAIVSGSRPNNNCTSAAFAIGALAVLQLLYVVVIQPFRTKLDMIFSSINALLLVTLSVVVAISVLSSNNNNDPSQAWVLKTVEVCLWLISVFGFVQLGVQAYWAYYVEQRRRYHEDRSDAEDSSDEVDDTNSKNDQIDHKSKPLLTVHTTEMKERVMNMDIETINTDSNNKQSAQNPLQNSGD